MHHKSRYNGNWQTYYVCLWPPSLLQGGRGGGSCLRGPPLFSRTRGCRGWGERRGEIRYISDNEDPPWKVLTLGVMGGKWRALGNKSFGRMINAKINSPRGSIPEQGPCWNFADSFEGFFFADDQISIYPDRKIFKRVERVGCLVLSLYLPLPHSRFESRGYPPNWTEEDFWYSRVVLSSKISNPFSKLNGALRVFCVIRNWEEALCIWCVN